MPPLSMIVIAIILLILIFIWAKKLKNQPVGLVNPNSFWQRLQSMFIENSETGIWSSNRVSYIFTMFISNVIIWGCILYLVILNSAFPSIPESLIAVYGISNGVASMAKVWQKREERFAAEMENKKLTDKPE